MSRADDQGVCPGCDGNEKTPIGCSVTNDILVDMGVIHQWILLFHTGGWSEVEDHAEVKIIKYPWQRDYRDSDIACEDQKQTS